MPFPVNVVIDKLYLAGSFFGCSLQWGPGLSKKNPSIDDFRIAAVAVEKQQKFQCLLITHWSPPEHWVNIVRPRFLWKKGVAVEHSEKLFSFFYNFVPRQQSSFFSVEGYHSHLPTDHKTVAWESTLIISRFIYRRCYVSNISFHFPIFLLFLLSHHCL